MKGLEGSWMGLERSWRVLKGPEGLERSLKVFGGPKRLSKVSRDYKTYRNLNGNERSWKVLNSIATSWNVYKGPGWSWKVLKGSEILVNDEKGHLGSKRLLKTLKGCNTFWNVVKTPESSWKGFKGYEWSLRSGKVLKDLTKFLNIIKCPIKKNKVLQGYKRLQMLCFDWSQNIMKVPRRHWKGPYTYQNVLKGLGRFMKVFKGHKRSWIIQKRLESFRKVSTLKGLERSRKDLKSLKCQS